MDIIENTRRRLVGVNLSEVSRRAGTAYGTVFNLTRNKPPSDLKVSTLDRINKAIDEMEAEQCNSDPTK